MNYRCYQIIRLVKHIYEILERCEVFIAYLSLGCGPGGDWANTWHWAKRFTVLCFKKLAVAVTVTATFSCLSHFLRTLYINIIIKIWMKYTIYLYNITVIYINNNAVINNNNNYGRIQDLILWFKLPNGMRKNFFAIYRQLWHAPSKRIAYSDPV